MSHHEVTERNDHAPDWDAVYATTEQRDWQAWLAAFHANADAFWQGADALHVRIYGMTREALEAMEAAF